jgi:hypothetical protein
VKVSDQLMVVRAQSDVMQHRLFNALAEAVKGKLEVAVPGLELTYGGKSTSRNQISATLTGNVADATGTAEDNIRQTMALLQSPALLASLLSHTR